MRFVAGGWLALLVGAAGLEPSEREECHQGECSSNGADDEGVHYQLVHGSSLRVRRSKGQGSRRGRASGHKALIEHRLEPMLKFLNGFAHIAQPDKAE
jgi:hypothetical protein